MKTAIVYGIRNKVTGLYYVGSTRELEIRWNLHRSLLEKNQHTKKLQDAWNRKRKIRGVASQHLTQISSIHFLLQFCYSPLLETHDIQLEGG